MPQRVGVVAAAIFMILPSQFRYAMEARPYAEALCFSLLAMLVLIPLLQGHTLFLDFAYVLLVTAALYTQPFAALAPCGATICVVMNEVRGRAWKRALGHIILVVVPGVLFLPWYFFASSAWAGAVTLGHFHFNRTLSLGLDFFKGISGGSFLCSAALVCLVILGVDLTRSTDGVGKGKWRVAAPLTLLLSAAGLVFVGVLVIDATQSYFFASRQILFALPALSIFAALGFRNAWRRNKAMAMALGSWLAIASLWNDASYQMHFRENWMLAAHKVEMASQDGYCLKMADHESLALFSVFVPGLPSDVCRDLRRKPKVALISTLYTDPFDLNAAQRELQIYGFTSGGTRSEGGTTITFEEGNKADLRQRTDP
jgi:hypothetical protein